MESNHFVSEGELNQQFSFFGNYYSIGATYEFRNVLCIVPKQDPSVKKIDFFKHQYDKLFVMMNPGGSKPLDEKLTIKRYPKRSNYKSGLDRLVLAAPDKTQYQLARIALGMGWESVCVINLSDNINSISSNFVKDIDKLPKNHTIFDESRKEELQHILEQIKNLDFACVAWGIKEKKAFITIADNALKTISNNKIEPVGLKSREGQPNLFFRHPLPRYKGQQEKWLNDMIKLLQSLKK